MPDTNGTQNGALESGTELKSNNRVPDATESDPCLDNPVTKTRKSETFERYVSQIQDRTGLSRRGVFVAGGVVLLSILLVIVVIALAAAWPRVPHSFQYPICREPACLRASVQLSENLNRSVSPCGDLWGAVCGGWLENHSRPADRSVWNQKQQLVKKELERVRDLISTLPVPLHTGTVEWNLKRLYEACLDVDTLNQVEDRPLKTIITELVFLDCLSGIAQLFPKQEFCKTVVTGQVQYISCVVKKL